MQSQLDGTAAGSLQQAASLCDSNLPPETTKQIKYIAHAHKRLLIALSGRCDTLPSSRLDPPGPAAPNQPWQLCR
jgi:hypothetical protein